jgi:hypothetical protein
MMWLAVIGGLLIGAGPVRAQPYTANELQYIRDARAIGVSVSTPDAAIAKIGWWICGRLTSGEAMEDIENDLLEPGDDALAITRLVGYAGVDLCPNAGKSW